MNPQRQTIREAIPGYISSLTPSTHVLPELLVREIFQRELRDMYGSCVPSGEAFAPRYDAAINRMHDAANRARFGPRAAAQTLAEVAAQGEIALLEAHGGYKVQSSPWRLSDAQFKALCVEFSK